MTAPVTARASADIAAEIQALEVERADMAARLAELEGSYSAVLLNESDKAAERHEAETAKVRRALARADLRLPMLRDELAAAEAREAAERKAEQQAAANRVVEEVLGRIATDYSRPAREIADFLARWQEAARIAAEAGVPGPDQRIRIVPGKVHPARTETYIVTLDHLGRETTGERPPGAYMVDEKTGRLVAADAELQNQWAQWRKVERTRHVPERREPDVVLAPLGAAVKLPGAAAEDSDFWPAAASTKAARP